jgi:hypothetical protein
MQKDPTARAKQLRDPSSWITSAQTQLRAARLLNEKLQARLAGEGEIPRPGGGATVDKLYIVDMDLFKPIYMLAGLSLELMFKAAIVHQDPSCIDDEGKPDWQKDREGHSLRNLAERAKTPEVDSGLLANLEPFITWKGRYPADHESFYEPPNLVNFAGSHVDEILDRVEQIYNAARAQITAKK